MSTTIREFDVVVVGGGPAGSTAAQSLASGGRDVLLLDRDGRIKPCGGAIPPQALREFGIAESLLKARIRGARMVSPTDRAVGMPIENGFVGMVDRDEFDEWLRCRAEQAGATRVRGTFVKLEYESDGRVRLDYQPKGDKGALVSVRARAVIGADGARSAVARQCIPGSENMPYVAAYHEIVESPAEAANDAFDGDRCDVYYQGNISPDFYGWVFPHGKQTSIGCGSAVKGHSLRKATAELRAAAGLTDVRTVRREGAPIPLKPLKRWDDGRAVLLAGDAAGVVAPASGEGIYYAMVGGQLAAHAVEKFCAGGGPAMLRLARRRFMWLHGRVFFILGMMQRFWYSSDKRRERFVSICADEDVQALTWEAYMNKRLVRARPGAHLRIFLKDMAHLFGIVRADAT